MEYESGHCQEHECTPSKPEDSCSISCTSVPCSIAYKKVMCRKLLWENMLDSGMSMLVDLHGE